MKKTVAPVMAIAIIILELLPFGAVLRFANPNSEKAIIKTFSYFDLTPYGYANFGPFLTALLTVALLVMLVVFCLKNKGLLAVRIISLIAVLTSVLPVIMFGISYFTIVGGCITALLIAECILSFVAVKQE